MLRRAAGAYPVAHLAAADVLAHQGSLAGARAELEAYLASGAQDYHVAAENWLKALANQTGKPHAYALGLGCATDVAPR